MMIIPGVPDFFTMVYISIGGILTVAIFVATCTELNDEGLFKGMIISFLMSIAIGIFWPIILLCIPFILWVKRLVRHDARRV